MGARIDLTGKRFGMLEVVRFSGVRQSTGKEHLYLCKCDCGNTKDVMAKNLVNGRTKSCGCIRGCESHGLAKTPTYFSWIGMKQRCMNPHATGYWNYGGRGIEVCARWASSFAAFVEDMGLRPAGSSLERRDNDGNYDPSNCFWATDKQQANNTRQTRRLSLYGESMPLTSWASRLGVEPATLRKRIQKGWTDAEVLLTPIRKRTKSLKENQDVLTSYETIVDGV